ncbi:MAG: alpha/beta hydrolase [Saprospiraceae bacterium]
MRTFLLLLIGLCVLAKANVCAAQDLEQMRLYLIPGTGADERLFHQLDLSNFDTVNIDLPTPLKKESLKQYSLRIATQQMDTTRPFAILGVSLGGMVATELADLLSPEAVVVIASAKTSDEIPPSYHLARYVPIHYLVGGKTMRWFTKQVQPRFEPMEDAQRDLFLEMLYGKDPAFLKGAVRMMVDWDRTDSPDGIIHIHGQHDHTIPYKHTLPTHSVVDAGHMLTYSMPEVVEGVLAEAVGN